MVESYFRHVKIDIFSNKLRNKAGRVIRKLHEDSLAKYNIAIHDFPQKKIKNIPNDSLNEIENWKSKTKSPNWFNQEKSILFE